jgi:F-box associated protein
MLTSLPPETLCLVLDRLPDGALLSLRATCKAFLHAITPRVFSDVSFSLSDMNTHHQLECLQCLSTPSCTIAPYVISLSIKRLYFPFANSASVKSLVSTVLSKYFPKFISRMCNLKTVW